MTKNSEGGNNRIVSRLDSVLPRINCIVEISSLNVGMEYLLYRSMSNIVEVKRMLNDNRGLELREVKEIPAGLDVERKYRLTGEWKNWF